MGESAYLICGAVDMEVGGAGCLVDGCKSEFLTIWDIFRGWLENKPYSCELQKEYVNVWGVNGKGFSPKNSWIRHPSSHA